MSDICSKLGSLLVKVREIPSLTNEFDRWDKTKITDDILSLMVKDVRSEPNEFGMVQVTSFSTTEFESLIPSATARRKINFKSENAKASVLRNYSNQRGVNLAFSILSDTVDSITDIAKNRGIDKVQILDEVTGQVSVPYMNVAQILGRQYLNSANVRLLKDTPARIAIQEAEIGKEILQPLIDDGLINFTKDGKVPYNGQYNEDLKYNAEKSQFIASDTISFNVDAINKHLEGTTWKATMAHARAVSRMVNPSREILPSHSPSSSVNLNTSLAHNYRATNNVAETFHMLNQGKHKIHGLFSGYLKSLGTKNNSTESTYESIENLHKVYPHDFLYEVLGSVLPDVKIFSIEESQKGISRTKSSNLVNIADNLSHFYDNSGNALDLFFDYFGFKSGRSLATQNVLNPQTDKHLARPILTSDPIDIEVKSPAFKKITGALIDDYGVKSIDNILDANTGLLDMSHFANAHDYATMVLESPEMKMYTELFLNPDGSYKQNWGVKELYELYNTEPTYIVKSDSIFDRLKGISLLHEVLTGIVNNKDNPNPSITISHHIAPDASGSGLFLNLLQGLHEDNPKVLEVMRDLGFMLDENKLFTAKYNSLYDYVAKELEEEVKAKRPESDIKGFQKDFKFIYDTNPYFNARNLAKMPVMTMGAYGQSTFNAKRNISNSLAQEMLTSMQLKRDPKEKVRQMLRLERILNKALEEDSKNNFGITKEDLSINNPDVMIGRVLQQEGVVQLLSNYFARDGGIADVLTSKAESKIKNGLYSKENSHIDSIYKQIEAHIEANDISPEKVKVIPPQVLFDLGISPESLHQMDVLELAKLTQKWGLPLTKRVEVLHEDGTTTNQEVLNKPSFIVSTTHMEDAAVQHLALNMSLKEYKATYGKYPAVKPIHDSNSSDPYFAEINDQNYTQAVFEVSKHWNKLNMLLLTAKSLGMVNNPTLQSIQEQVDKLEPSRQKNIDDIVHNLDNSQYIGNAKVYGYRHTTQMNPFNLNEYLGISEVTNFNADQIKKYAEIKEFLKKNPNVQVDLNSDEFFYNASRGQGIDPNDKTHAVLEVIQAINLKNDTHTDLATAAKLNYLHHEIGHANTNSFIDNAIINNTKDAQYVHYLNDVLDNLVNAKMSNSIDTAIDKLYGKSNKITHLDPTGKPLTQADYIRDRLEYIIGEHTGSMTNNSINGVKEFVAIVNGEPDFTLMFSHIMSEIYPKENMKFTRSVDRDSELSTFSSFRDIIKRMINNIKNWVLNKSDRNVVKGGKIRATSAINSAVKLQDLGITDRDTEGFETDRLRPTNAIMGATNNTDTSQEQNTEKKSAREQAFEYRLYEGSSIAADPFSAGSAIANQYARVAIALTLGNFGKSVYDGYMTNKHRHFMEVSPIYREVMKLLQGARQNTHVQQILHYMNVDNFKDVVAKTQLLAKFNDSVRERNKIDNSYVRNLSDKLEAKYTPQEIAKINTVYSKTGVFALTHDSTILLDLLANDNSVIKDDVFLDRYIADYIKNNKLSATEAGKARGLAKIYVHSEVDGSITTDNLRAYSQSKDKAYKLETLASLYAMKETNGLETMRRVIDETPEIHQEMVHVAVGIKAVLNQLEKRLGSTEAPITANIVGDVYKNNYQIIAVDLQTFNKGHYDEDWKVLRRPTAGKLGLVYRPNINTRQSGLGTDNNFSVDGLVLDNYKASKYTNLIDNNAVSIYMGKEKATKILFTEKEKATLGLVENPAHSLYRTYAHLLFLLDSQDIRDKLVTDAFTKTITNKTTDIEALQNEIKNPDQEHSWFLNISSNVNFNDLPKQVRELYQPVDHITNLGQMASKISHVRKDIAPWLVGYAEPELVTKNYKMNRVANVFKKLVAMQKIKWVIVNPPKIVFDAISNTTYLISRNVGLPKILRYGKAITEALPQLNELRNNIVAAKLFANADPMNKDKQDRVKKAVEEMNNHPYAFIFKNGYVSSISTDLIMKENATVTGLENDIENFLNKIVRDNSGDLNSIGKFVMKVGKFGVSTEDALNVVGNLLDKNKTTKTVGNALSNVASELSRIKDKDDAAKYLMQFMAAPGSEAVKLGSIAVQGIDIVSKGILHMHLKDLGKTEAEAVSDVTESFFDYTANMPESMKILSDYMVLLFPTFWARVQRAIYRLGKEQPVSLASAILLTEMAGLDSAHYLGSNIVSKFNNGSILNSPGITADAFIPTKLMPFSF